MDNKESAKEMYETVMDAVIFLDGLTVDRNNAADVIDCLMRVYLCAAKLRYGAPGEKDWRVKKEIDRIGEKKKRVRVECGEKDYYNHVAHPYDDDSVLGFDLSMDLQEVFEELTGAAALYEAGYEDEAVWNWGWGLDFHWGYHLINTIRPLHEIRLLCGWEIQSEEKDYFVSRKTELVREKRNRRKKCK